LNPVIVQQFLALATKRSNFLTTAAATIGGFRGGGKGAMPPQDAKVAFLPNICMHFCS